MSVIKYNKVKQRNEDIPHSNGTKSRWKVKDIPTNSNDFGIDLKLIDLLKKLFDNYPATTFKLLCFFLRIIGSDNGIYDSLNNTISLCQDKCTGVEPPVAGCAFGREDRNFEFFIKTTPHKPPV